jgi:membrane-associated phospholipid phosphatase
MLLERSRRLVRDARSEWGAFAFVPFLTTAYVAALLVLGGQVRTEHWILGVIVPVLGFAGARGARFLRDVFPWLFVIMSYDTVRYARAAVLRAENVMGCGLRAAELKFFSVAPGTTLQDWFVAHHRLGLDLFFAVPYGVFAYFALAYASYLYVRDRPRMRRFLWAFALANVMSYALWLLVPAAPPWYVRTHGCAIDLHALPSEGAALARVDAVLGVSYFHAFYSRASSVFGAMPSMHCAYPTLGLLTAWHKASWRTRPLHLFYVFWMAGAAVYLDHHWLLDVLGGWLVAIVAVAGATALLKAVEGRGPAAGVPALAAEERGAA